MKLTERMPGKSNKISLDGRMRCHRCGSIMVYEKYYGLQEHFWGWRCICCGDIVVGYRFYCLDEKGKDHLVGILPERRFNPARITDRSIMNWTREIVGNRSHGRRIYFVRVNMPEGDQEVH